MLKTITGAGASFPYPIYAKWAGLYEKETGNKVNYQSIGSGGGQQQIIAKTIDFGASDDPMKGENISRTQTFAISRHHWGNCTGCQYS
ncbi:Phosphate-binding protein pstS precursor [Mannheimia haemolytica]|nr:Phosphate-binding protein pstS precursor [Mannheimia haemolytica]